MSACRISIRIHELLWELRNQIDWELIGLQVSVRLGYTMC